MFKINILIHLESGNQEIRKPGNQEKFELQF